MAGNLGAYDFNRPLKTNDKMASFRHFFYGAEWETGLWSGAGGVLRRYSRHVPVFDLTKCLQKCAFAPLYRCSRTADLRAALLTPNGP